MLRGTFAEVRLEPGPFAEGRSRRRGVRLSARLTRRAADDLGLAQGRAVFALIKTIALGRVVRADGNGA